ncbi:MAG: hypothetical protein WC295_08510, partial [Methanoregula sp.]
VLHEEVERHQSRLRAQNAIERVAVAGRFTAVSFNSAGIVFEKEADGTVTRLSIRKVGPKVFESVHTTLSTDAAPDTQRPEVGGTIPGKQEHAGVRVTIPSNQLHAGATTPGTQVHERRRK